MFLYETAKFQFLNGPYYSKMEQNGHRTILFPYIGPKSEPGLELHIRAAPSLESRSHLGPIRKKRKRFSDLHFNWRIRFELLISIIVLSVKSSSTAFFMKFMVNG